MMRSISTRYVLPLTWALFLHVPHVAAQPETPVVDYVSIASDHARSDAGIIWSDDFESGSPLGASYQDVGSNGGRFGLEAGAGIAGSSGISQRYDSGQVGAGWLWKFFGDHPSTNAKGYREVYMRFYHKFDTGFLGVPPKMARLGSFARSDWTLACMAHYWWGTKGATSGLAIADVASNIAKGGTAPMESGYNKLGRWLPVAISRFNVDTVPNKGRWICFEMRLKLNDSGASNCEYEYWADGEKIVDVEAGDLVGAWRERGINAAQLDCYWNDGAPRSQSRYYDNWVIATGPIGPARSSVNPLIRKSPYRAGDGSTQRGWQVQVSSARNLDAIVWDSGLIDGASDTVTVSGAGGTFSGALAGSEALSSDSYYYCRVRARSGTGVWSDWSPWHAVFLTEAAAPASIDGGGYPDLLPLWLD